LGRAILENPGFFDGRDIEDDHRIETSIVPTRYLSKPIFYNTNPKIIKLTAMIDINKHATTKSNISISRLRYGRYLVFF